MSIKRSNFNKLKLKRMHIIQEGSLFIKDSLLLVFFEKVLRLFRYDFTFHDTEVAWETTDIIVYTFLKGNGDFILFAWS